MTNNTDSSKGGRLGGLEKSSEPKSPHTTKSLPLVSVHWVDVHNIAGGWNDTDELKAFAADEAYNVNSVGFLVYEDDKCIVLCARYSAETDKFEAHYGMLERIPKKIIDSRRVVNTTSTDKTGAKG
jgi:hypothetical protein